MNVRNKKIRLIKKTLRNSLGIGLLLMIISLVFIYFSIHYYIDSETEEGLFSVLNRIEVLLEEDEKLGSIPPIIEIQKSEHLGKQKIKDTLIFDASQNEVNLFRELSSYKSIKGEKYKISVRTLVVESEDIILSILESFVFILFISLLIQIYLNKKSAEVTWKPFFHNLEKIKTFSIQDNKPLYFDPIDIIEFSELNIEIEALTKKVSNDYQNLKQFTEDASHEIQTPLAIIQAKIGNLTDEGNLSEKQYRSLVEVQKSIQRLAQLNKKLVLLSKIENRQFISNTKVGLAGIVKKSVDKFEEVTNAKIVVSYLGSFLVKIDQDLAFILIDNLLSNAIKHNINDKDIIIEVKDRFLTVKNTGISPITNPEKLFNRFYRESTTDKSLGLGLAIVKKICTLHGLKISYFFKGKFHHFTIES